MGVVDFVSLRLSVVGKFFEEVKQSGYDSYCFVVCYWKDNVIVVGNGLVVNDY